MSLSYVKSADLSCIMPHSWSETGRPLSMSSVITISQPPVVPGDKANLEPSEGITFAPAPDSDEDIDDFSDSFEDPPAGSSNLSPATPRSSQLGDSDTKKDETRSDESGSGSGQTTNTGKHDEEKQKARVGSLEKLQGGCCNKGKEKDLTAQDAVAEEERKEREEEKEEEKDKLALHPVRIKPRLRSSRVPEAVIVLKEEKASWSLEKLPHPY